MAIPKVKIVYNRRKTASNTKKASLEIEVNYDKKQKFFSTGIMLLPKEWNDGDKRIKGANAVQGNRDLDMIVSKTKAIINEMVDNGSIDIEAIPKILKGKLTDKTFLEFVEERIEKRVVSDHTKNNYVYWFGAFSRYGGIKYFSDIVSSSIIKYDEYLHTVKNRRGGKLAQPTIKAYHRLLQTFIEDAIVFGYVKDNPYASSKIKIESNNKEYTDYLVEEQVLAIEKLLLKGKTNIAKDLFLLQCYTGLAYADILNFDKNKVIETDYGKVYISRRVKTKKKFTVLLNPKAISLLDKYEWKIPFMRNGLYNTRLKTIGKMIGEEHLHSHQGRGAFATIALNNGINVDVLRRMLGHTDVSMTNHYASMLDVTVISEMKTKLS